MHDPEARVALRDGVDHHTECNEVENLLEIELITHHFAVDGVKVLGAPVDLGGYPGVDQALL